MKMSKRIAEENIEKALKALEKTKTDSGLLKNIARFILVRKA